MTHNLPVRSRDDLLFGNKEAAEKRKDPEPSPALQRQMDALDASSSADDYKAVGNACYSDGLFGAAIRHYSKAIEMEPDNYVHYSNRSAAYVNSVLVSGPSLALRDAGRCVELNPSWFKGHLRRADALFAQDKLEEALVAYDKVISLNPDCSIAVNSRSECLRRQLMSGEGGPASSSAAGGSSARGGVGSGASDSFRRPSTRQRGGFEGGAEERIRRPNEGHPTEERTDELIKTWSKDTELSDSKTATRRYGASVAEADRDAGRAAKEAFMSRYKKRVAGGSEEAFAATVHDSLEREKLAGAGFDYRRAAQNRQKKYANGTDEVGAAISADCYKSYTYKGSAW